MSAIFRFVSISDRGDSRLTVSYDQSCQLADPTQTVDGFSLIVNKSFSFLSSPADYFSQWPLVVLQLKFP